MSQIPEHEQQNETADAETPAAARSGSKLPILGIALVFYMALGLLCLIAAAVIALSLYSGR